jgi:hypothetical protein
MSNLTNNESLIISANAQIIKEIAALELPQNEAVCKIVSFWLTKLINEIESPQSRS